MKEALDGSSASFGRRMASLGERLDSNVSLTLSHSTHIITTRARRAHVSGQGKRVRIEGVEEDLERGVLPNEETYFLAVERLLRRLP